MSNDNVSWEYICKNKNDCEYLKILLYLRAEADMMTKISLKTHNYIYLIFYCDWGIVNSIPSIVKDVCQG